MPRLQKFRSQFPEIDVKLDVTITVEDFRHSQIDVAIRYGSGKCPGVTAKRLLEDERLIVIASPKLLNEQPDLVELENIVSQTLIHDEAVKLPDYPEWKDWFIKAGLRGYESARSLNFNSTLAVIDAALLGQGVALT